MTQHTILHLIHDREKLILMLLLSVIRAVQVFLECGQGC